MSSPSEALLAAVAELLVESGYEGVSVRRVAARAGVSIGAVQHHFPTKDAMLVAAMELVSTDFQARLERRVDADATAEEALYEVVDQLLGTGLEERAATVLWTLRLARAMVDQAMAQQHATEWQRVEDLLARLLLGSRPERGRAWAGHEAAALLALVDGLAPAIAAEPARMPAARAQALVRQHLDRVLGPGGWTR